MSEHLVEMTLGHREMMPSGCRDLSESDVPALPEGLTPGRSGNGDLLYDHENQRWRYSPTGALKGYFRYRRYDADRVEWEEMFWHV